MKFINQAYKINKIVPAICFSLLIHFAAAVFMVIVLSNDVSVQKLKGLNLVWISLDSVNRLGKFELKNDRAVKIFPPVEKMADVKTNTELRSVSTQTMQITASTPTTREPANTVSLVDSGISSAVKERSNNTDGYNVNKNAGKASNLDTTIAYPLYKENAPPVYPSIARIRGYEGVVLISAEVLPDGRVGNMKIRKSSGYTILDQSAIKAVKPWKFEPAKKYGSPFTVWVDLPIKFILHNENSHS